MKFYTYRPSLIIFEDSLFIFLFTTGKYIYSSEVNINGFGYWQTI